MLAAAFPRVVIIAPAPAFFRSFFSPSIPRSEVATQGKVLRCFLPTRAAARFACFFQCLREGPSLTMGSKRKKKRHSGKSEKGNLRPRSSDGCPLPGVCCVLLRRSSKKWDAEKGHREEKARARDRRNPQTGERLFVCGKRLAGMRKLVTPVLIFLSSQLASTLLRSLSSFLSLEKWPTPQRRSLPSRPPPTKRRPRSLGTEMPSAPSRPRPRRGTQPR